MTARVAEYIRADGSGPFGQWFERLDATSAAKVTTALMRLEQGNTSNVKWFSGIGEYVINWGPGFRIYLAEDGPTLVILFTGGTKRRQVSDIARALKLYEEYKARKRRQSPRPGVPERATGRKGK
jgi:putative addiction module killer protein